MHNQVTKFGTSVGTTLKLLKDREPITDRVEQSLARIDKLEEFINTLDSAFTSIKTSEGLPKIRIPNLCMFLKIRVLPLVRRSKND